MSNKRVLVVYYSYTQQTRTLLRKFTQGLQAAGVEVTQERIVPIRPYDVPFKSNLRLLAAMTVTLFQRRMAINPVSDACYENFDCVVLAGPTWSYNPSGPVLDFLDRFGKAICGGKVVTPFISCRSYWSYHYWILKKMLRKYGTVVADPIVFTHPVREPWRSIGLFLKLRGKMAQKKHAWLKRRYPQYGHDAVQRQMALEAGKRLAERLMTGTLL